MPGARALAVLSTRTPDEFAETLAVIELLGAFDTTAPAADELRRALPASFAAPQDIATDVVANAPLSVRGRGESSTGSTYDAVLVPSGQMRRLVVVEVRADEAVLYEDAMDEALAGLTGMAAPIVAFDASRVRTIAIVGWMVVTALALAFAMWRRPFGAGARTIGRVLAGACLILAALTAALAWTPLAAHGAELRLAGISATTLTAELLTYGLLAAVACWIAGFVLGRTEGPVASAPTSGAFAHHGTSIPRVPKPSSDGQRAGGVQPRGGTISSPSSKPRSRTTST
ncbi:MAG TPA: hypothetical protein VFG69_21845, partial [Nannocystaceae bacterium]|nr:hypothetical protein [Nannocystaceae bacterium]